MYLGRGEALLLMVLAVGGGRGEVPGDRLVYYYCMYGYDGQGEAEDVYHLVAQVCCYVHCAIVAI